jgi:peptidyl-prolyl cis-trans isomerase C
MSSLATTSCGSGLCGCVSAEGVKSSAFAADELAQGSALNDLAVPDRAAVRINGIELKLGTGQETDIVSQAHAELLRQEAVSLGLLAPTLGNIAPEITSADQAVIESMLDAAVLTPEPTDQECQRYYEANKSQFTVGQALHVRHILFAVTPGVNVHALTVHAEKALLSLLSKDVAADQFAKLAREFSNCPTGSQGGDLGWIGPEDCAPELGNELFRQKDAQWGMGVHPRLVHSRFGFHIIEVLARRKGQQKTFAEVRERIVNQLTMQSRAKALHQYMQLLVGRADVQGIEIQGADSPLVQ